MLVLGIDLAAQPASTAAVWLEPSEHGRRTATCAGQEPDDDLLIELAARADLVGLDAPLGWPEPFVTAVSAHQRHEAWPGTSQRRPLTHRRTDDVVVELGWGRPMSASADRLGSVAMRAALLQREWALRWGEPAPRDGSGRLAETYPAAALTVWQVPAKGYKASGARAGAAAEVRAGIVEHLVEHGPRWLDISPIADAAVRSDHVLDALLCALIMCAVAGGDTLAPRDGDEARLAGIEGWIHVPTCELAALRPA